MKPSATRNAVDLKYVSYLGCFLCKEGEVKCLLKAYKPRFLAVITCLQQHNINASKVE